MAQRTRPPDTSAAAAPTTTAMPIVRVSVVRSVSRNGCHGVVIESLPPGKCASTLTVP